MKTINIIKALLSVVFLATIIVTIDSCKGGNDPGPDNTPTEAARVTGLLMSGSWKIKSLTIDGVAKGDYANLVLTFGQTSFSSTGGAPVWPTSGTWAFTDDTAKMFKRDDQTVVAIESIDQNNLTVSLTWSQATIGPGRVTSIAGKHVFVMGK